MSDEPASTVIASSTAIVPRTYRLHEVFTLLGVFALTVLLFDSGGLVTWAQRLHSGRARRAWLAVLEPLHHALDRIGAASLRTRGLRRADQLARALGSGASEDTPALSEHAAAREGAPVGEPASTVPLLDAVARTAGASQTPVDREMPATTATVLLVGDSMMAVGISRAMLEEYKHDSTLRFVRGFRSATGLSQPAIYDWMQALPPMLDRYRPRFVVCAIGGNDGVDMRARDSRSIEYGTDSWDAAYRQRARAFGDLLVSRGAHVLWLALPAMRSASFHRTVQHINALVSESVAGIPRLMFVDTASAIAREDGAFSTYLSDSFGRSFRVRDADGVHVTELGGGRVLRQIVYPWLHARAASLRPPHAE